MIYEIDSVKLVRIKGIPHSFTNIQKMLNKICIRLNII